MTFINYYYHLILNCHILANKNPKPKIFLLHLFSIIFFRHRMLLESFESQEIKVVSKEKPSVFMKQFSYIKPSRLYLKNKVICSVQT